MWKRVVLKLTDDRFKGERLFTGKDIAICPAIRTTTTGWLWWKKKEVETVYAVVLAEMGDRYCPFQGAETFHYWTVVDSFNNYQEAVAMERLLTPEPEAEPEVGMPFTYKIGWTYKTQEGKLVKVLGRTELKGYECLECSDGVYRYDRSTHNEDAGRVTGTCHKYSDPRNFKR